MEELLESKVKKVYDFHNVNVPEKLLEVQMSEKTITDAITDVAERFLTIVEADDAIVVGDIITADLESNIVKFNKNRTQISVGKGYFSTELENSLLGMKKNEEKTISPNGNPVKIRITNVKRRIFATVTDEMIRKLNMIGINTIAEYKRYVYDKSFEQQKGIKLYYLADFIKKEVADKSEFDAIDEEIKPEYDSTIQKLNEEAESSGMSYGEYITKLVSLKLKNPTLKVSESFIYEDCASSIKYKHMGILYASQNGVEYNHETYEKELREAVEQYQTPLEELKKMNPYLKYANASYIEYCSRYIQDAYADKIVINGYSL